MLRPLTACLLSLAGCAASGAAVGGAVLNTAIAAGAAAHERSEGRCYAPCTPGTRCNAHTGFCDPLPCRGECGPQQRCNESGLIPRCVADVDVRLDRKAGVAPPTADAPAKP